MADLVIVDDSIDSSIVYSPPASWLLGGVPQERDETTHGTETPGATATFAFNGTSVQVFGTIGPAGPDPNNPNNTMSTYSIDGSIIDTYLGQASQIGVQYNVQFFQSPTLKPAGEHTLTITNTGNHGFLFLDYIQFVPITTTTSASTAGPSTTTPSSTASQSPDVASPHSLRISTGALIGAVIGAATVLFIMAFLIWFLRRRLVNLKRRLIEPEMGQKVMTSSPGANPAGSDGRLLTGE